MRVLTYRAINHVTRLIVALTSCLYCVYCNSFSSFTMHLYSSVLVSLWPLTLTLSSHHRSQIIHQSTVKLVNAQCYQLFILNQWYQCSIWSFILSLSLLALVTIEIIVRSLTRSLFPTPLLIISHAHWHLRCQWKPSQTTECNWIYYALNVNLPIQVRDVTTSSQSIQYSSNNNVTLSWLLLKTLNMISMSSALSFLLLLLSSCTQLTFLETYLSSEHWDRLTSSLTSLSKLIRISLLYWMFTY